MNPDRKAPIIAKVEKTRKDPKVVGTGRESISNVKSFEISDESGKIHSYVEKRMKYEESAKHTLTMYKQLQGLGLPVVDFLKIVKKRGARSDIDHFSIAMQDLSDRGQNLVLRLGGYSFDGTSGHHYVAAQLIEQAVNGEQVIDQMAKALAVLHNNDIYEFHDTLSFFIVVKRSEIKRNHKFSLQFKILDYSNFDFAKPKLSYHDDDYVGEQTGFEVGVIRNLRKLKERAGTTLTSDFEIANLYSKYRKEGIKTFS